MRHHLIAGFAVLLFSLAANAFAASPAHEAPHDPASTTPAATTPHDQPVLPAEHVRWPGAMVIIIGGMFLAAAIIGPVVRANMPEEPPAPHHDDFHDQGGHGHSH